MSDASFLPHNLHLTALTLTIGMSLSFRHHPKLEFWLEGRGSLYGNEVIVES